MLPHGYHHLRVIDVIMSARQIAVKAKYGLWVTQPEKDAIIRLLEKCVGQKIPN